MVLSAMLLAVEIQVLRTESFPLTINLTQPGSEDDVDSYEAGRNVARFEDGGDVIGR